MAFEVGDEVMVANRGYYQKEVGVIQHIASRRGVVKRQSVDSEFNPIGSQFYDEYDETWVLLDNGVWFQAFEIRHVIKDW